MGSYLDYKKNKKKRKRKKKPLPLAKLVVIMEDML